MKIWAFAEDPDLGVITTSAVLAGAPILMISHDADDGGWQFLCGTTTDPADGRIVHLKDIVAMDPTVAEVADIPLGWVAFRSGSGGRWTREPQNDE
jgi:hypothetical protein